MSFLNEEYLLGSEPARQLYDEIHDSPILDPHSHLDVQAVAQNDG